MSARDHDLAQSVAADNSAIAAPTSPSPPRRDPVEDADPSFTRKRPRLDSGSNSVPAMSAGAESPAPSAAPPHEQQVEMTIRSHPPSSPALGSEEDVSPVLTANADDLPGSPRVMLVETEEDPALSFSIQLDPDEHFCNFPYAHNENYSQVVRDLAQHFHGSGPLDGELLPLLTTWLLELPEPSADTQEFYVTKAGFWDDFAAAVNKLINRRFTFGDHFQDDGLTGTIFYRFMSAYLGLCSLLLLADVQQLSRPRSEQIYSSTLLSQKHIRLLHIITRAEKAPIFHVLHREYNIDVREVGIRLHKDFLKAKGVHNLLHLLDEVHHQVAPKVQDMYATFGSQLLSTMGWTIFELPGANAYMPRSDYYRRTLSLFQKYSGDLQDPSRGTDAAIARDLITHFSALLSELCRWDESIAAELMDQLLDFGAPESPTMALSPVHTAVEITNDYRQDSTCFSALIMNGWKFKTLRKHLVKGNMGLRVMSIATMDAALVEIWREYNNIEPNGYHPVMQYLADFLLQGQVVNYIVSVDSHPQLISRSGNIVGFLVVTHRWSDSQADSIWNTVSNSTDPRVVVATMTMLRGIIGLMKPTHHLHLCEKLYDLPVERFTLDILRFLRDLTIKLSDSLDPVDYNERGPEAHPWNVCIRVLRDTAPFRGTDKALLDLHSEAMDQLRNWISIIPADERQIALRQSARYIADQSEKATGSVRVFTMLASSLYSGDSAFFQQNQDLVQSVLEEIPRFVEKEAQADPYPYLLQALHYRLDFLKQAICHVAMTIPPKLYKGIWDHVIGEHSLSSEARDLAWVQFLHAVKTVPANDFCKQLVGSYIPTMNPRLYTSGLFDFVASYPFPIIRTKATSEHGEEIQLQVPGAELLWPMILLSPVGTIEDRAARMLAIRYVKIVDDENIQLAEIESAHIALVKRCISELRNAYRTLSQLSAKRDSPIAIESTSDYDTRETTEIRFGRILLFQKLLLEFIRQKPEFNRGRRVDSKVDTMETNIPVGEAIVVRYQCGNDRSNVNMGADHTLDDLYRRLCHATGYTKINLFARGQRLKIPENAALPLSQMDFGGQVIVQRAEGGEISRPLSGPTRGSSIFETTIVEHFDEMFAWMDSDGTTSHLLFDFLTYIPAPSTFADSVMSDNTSAHDLFPPGKVYQARYAAQSLQTRLREQIRSSALDETFISKAVQHLEMAILDLGLISSAKCYHQELQLGAVLVEVLLEFLRERPSPELSAGYFNHGAAFVDRLITFSTITIAIPDFAAAAHDAYGAILEASLHSRNVWEAFTRHPESQSIHTTLLLTHPSQLIREKIARKILSVCGGDLPSTSPVTRAETASCYWAILSTMIPDAVRHSQQSQQFFEAAEQVFRTHDEYSRNELALRSFLEQWGTLLIEHEHEEFVGREEVDHVVLGMTRLLLCCILSIKSFKKPVNSGSLMRSVFNKFIFTSSTQSNEDLTDSWPLPVLESQTRQELYDLMLALAEDRVTYDTLLKITGDVENDQPEQILSPNFVDRAMEIRSNTGYVGLHNPRAICYMNSLMTQLFMNRDFRQFILGVEVKEPTGSQRLLAETQRLFAQMQNSFRRSTDPRDFAACVKSLDKTPIDITVQMDADEFYNLLFDQWEAQLFQPEHKQKFRSFYGGQTLNQIKSKECEHVSERAEPFFAVQCDVQGKSNLHESLQAYVQGDVMEGDNKYKCESCNGKFVDAVKRTCLKDVPDNLIFHLKRFEFDLNDFSRRKIYDHFAFEESIDISPYKVEHLADPSLARQEDIFDLVGVLVHTGTCENGHYYSYIRERPGRDGEATPTWIEFNDSDVGPFNPAEIADRAFGGFFDIDGYTRQTKQYSAYMLFYQRRTRVDVEAHQPTTSTSARLPKAEVPEALQAEINVNNELFIREYCLFDPVHAKFVRQLQATSRTVNHGTCSEDHEQETKALHIVLAHLSRIAWRKHTSDPFMELLGQLRRLILSCSVCCSVALKWFAADDNALTHMLLKCTHVKIRSHVRMLLIDSLKYLREQDPILYGLESLENDMDVDSPDGSDGLLAHCTQRLRKTADETGDGVRGWDDYYLTLTQLAEMGHFETAMLLNYGFLEFCLQLFCMHRHQAFRSRYPDLARIMEKRRGIFNRLISFTWTLLSSIDQRLPAITEHESHGRQATFDREYMKFPLNKKERGMVNWWCDELTAITVLDKILEVFDDAKVTHFYPGDILKWMLESPDSPVQTDLYRTMVEGLQLDPPYCDGYIRAALPYCEACPKPEHIPKIITLISKAVSSPERIAEDRSPNGAAVLDFLAGLLMAENDRLFKQKHPHAFHQFLMLRAPMYGIAILCHYDEFVRRASQALFRQLYTNEDALPAETVQVKYGTMRNLLSDMMHKIVCEKEVGQTRSFLTPIIETCRSFVEQLFLLTRSQEPEIQPFQDPNDAALIYQYQQEIEGRVRLWPHDEGTPLSTGETFDQSDYGSESDDAHEIVDMTE